MAGFVGFPPSGLPFFWTQPAGQIGDTSQPLSADVLYSDDDVISASTAIAGAATLVPTLIATDDIFSVPLVAPGAVVLAPALYQDDDVTYSSSVAFAFVLASASYTDSDSFSIPALSASTQLLPALVGDAEVFPAPVAASLVTLQPQIFTDADSFYVPIETSVLVESSGFADVDVVQTSTITVGAATLAPALVTSGDAISAPILASVLQPIAVVDSDTFFVPIIRLLTQFLAPSAVVSDDLFLAPGIGAGGQLLPISVYNDADVFLIPTVQPGSVSVTAPAIIDSDNIYAPASSSQIGMQPGLVVAADQIAGPVASQGIFIEAFPYQDLDAVLSPTIGFGTSLVNLKPVLVYAFDAFPHDRIVGGAQPLPKPPMSGSMTDPAYMFGSLKDNKLKSSMTGKKAA